MSGTMPRSIRSPAVAAQDLELHPTVKPTALVADALQDVTKRGDLVLDTFLGSGTTLIAAERCGRRFRGVEIDPAYVDVAIERWQAITGKEAQRLEGGVALTKRVGRGNPPLETRFRKGQSGNPGGRPKGRRADDAVRLRHPLRSDAERSAKRRVARDDGR